MVNIPRDFRRLRLVPWSNRRPTSLTPPSYQEMLDYSPTVGTHPVEGLGDHAFIVALGPLFEACCGKTTCACKQGDSRKFVFIAVFSFPFFLVISSTFACKSLRDGECRDLLL